MAQAQLTAGTAPAAKKPFYRLLYDQVLFGILLGVVLGCVDPQFAQNAWIKALGDGFIKLIKMIIGPIIFCTVVSGIAHIQDAKKVGRVGVKALVYFEIVSTFALAIGLLVGNIVQPGAGFSGKAPDPNAVAGYAKAAGEQKSVDFVLNIIPDSVVGALAKGDILQILLFAILFGFAVMAMGERGKALRTLIDDVAHGVDAVDDGFSQLVAFAAAGCREIDQRVARQSHDFGAQGGEVNIGGIVTRLAYGRFRADDIDEGRPEVAGRRPLAGQETAPPGPALCIVVSCL